MGGAKGEEENVYNSDCLMFICYCFGFSWNMGMGGEMVMVMIMIMLRVVSFGSYGWMDGWVDG